MGFPAPADPTPNRGGSLFPATRWSLVVDAKQSTEGDALRALGELCQSYWLPLYTCARRAGLSPQDAEDCVQGFFARLVEKRSIDLVHENKGRLRAFFRVSIKNYIAEQWNKSRRLKRGGGALHLSIDREWAEEQLSVASVKEGDSDSAFDRVWANQLLKTVFARLDEHYAKSGRSELFEAIRGSLVGGGNYGSVDAISQKTGMSATAVRAAVFKLRGRFREYVEAGVRDTCADDAEAREEIRHLCKILAS